MVRLVVLTHVGLPRPVERRTLSFGANGHKRAIVPTHGAIGGIGGIGGRVIARGRHAIYVPAMAAHDDGDLNRRSVATAGPCRTFYAGRRTDFEVTPIRPTIAVQDQLWSRPRCWSAIVPTAASSNF